MPASLSSITLIGGGNMGSALAQAWLPTMPDPASIHVVEPHEARRQFFALKGMTTHASFEEAPLQQGLVVLAIKPQSFAALAAPLAEAIAEHHPLLISIMAGVPLASLTPLSSRAVRVMPNTPVVIGKGMAVAFSPALSMADHGLVNKLFAAAGSIAWVAEEAQMHAATALSGSGPAYMFAMLEGLQQAGQSLGLSPALAQQLAVETMRGAAELAAHSPLSFAQLRDQVTSPQGTTEAGLKELLAGNQWFEILERTLAAAAARSEALSKAMG